MEFHAKNGKTKQFSFELITLIINDLFTQVVLAVYIVY